MKKKRKSNESPTIVIENCTLTGAMPPSMEALARAIEANSNAILSLSQSLQRPNTLIQIGGKE